MDTDSNIFKTLKIDSTKLSPIDLPSEQEKENWKKELFIGKEGSQFYVDLPPEYNYNYDVRLNDTNSFVVEDKNYPQFKFTVIGEEISQFFQNSEDLSEFKSSINSYLDKIISSLKKAGAEISRENFELRGIETENSWWCRTILSYNTNIDAYLKNDGYNFLGKALIGFLGVKKSLEKAGYKKGQNYKEYKIIDFFFPKSGFKNPFFAMVYGFDEIGGGKEGSVRKRMRAINGMSNTLGYWDKTKD